MISITLILYRVTKKKNIYIKLNRVRLGIINKYKNETLERKTLLLQNEIDIL